MTVHTLPKSAPRSARLVLAGACLAMSIGCASLPPIEREQLMAASRQYTAGDTASATSTLDRIIRDYGQTAEISEAYYIRGLCRFKARQMKGAAEDFNRGIAMSKRADLTARCRASLAAIEFEKGDWKRAADLYGQAVGDLPDVAPTDAVLLEAGIAMQRAGKWREADTQFARILNKFRNQPTAVDARRMSLWRHAYFSIQYGAYRDTDNAGKAVQTLRRQGLDPTKEYLPRDGQPLWVIMAGQYRTYDEARAALARIRQHQPQATIVP